MTNNQSSGGLDTPFKLFASKQRVLAQNIDGKIIDIGSIESSDGKHYLIALDVDPVESAPSSTEQGALEALAATLSFDYLDGLFTSEASTEVHGKLDDLPHVSFVLDEPLPRSITDKNPPERF
jgi:hypothetical protein